MSSSSLRGPDSSESRSASPPTLENPIVTPGERRAFRRASHYRRPQERPFLAGERDKITILIGGLTRKHDRFIQAVFHSPAASSATNVNAGR